MQPAAGATNETKGALWSVATAFAFSMSAILGKDLLGALGAPSMLFFRFGIAAVVLWAGLLVWRRHGGPDVFAVPQRTAVLVGLLFGFMTITGFLALRYLDASVYIVVVYLYPVLVVVGSSVLGHRVVPAMWVALAVVMGGIVLTVPELFSGTGKVSVLGITLTLTQAVLMAAYMIVTNRVLPGLDGVVNAAWTLLGATLAMAPLVVIGGLHVPHTGSRVAEVVAFAIVTAVISNVCFFRAMKYINPGVVAMIMTLEVALALLWSVLFLGEHVQALKLLGAGVVIAGVLLAQWVNLNQARRTP